MEVINKHKKKPEEQRKKENQEYIKNLKKHASKKKNSFMHLVGSISKEAAERMQQHIKDERNNW